MFKAVSTQVRFPEQEVKMLEFWKQNEIYEKSLQQRAGAESFVFYEGPPTANGLPHPGHCLTRAIKDLFPRYKTMRGYLCERKAGWDTHGLPVEVEVCKELGIHSKEEIERYGIEPFIQKCQQSVWKYMQDWEVLTERLGFWIDLSEAYVTYHQSYVESVWWSLKKLFDQGLLYRGHKIVWWWAQGGTALSAGEVGQGYREVADPSVFVKFPLVDSPQTSLVVWTTTPWTLPSNMYAAVHPEIEYAVCRVEDSEEELIVASALVDSLAEKVKQTWQVIRTLPGSELVGMRYQPPLDTYHAKWADAQGELVSGGQAHLYWRVLAADFVTLDSGTGLVHIAPAFGEVDYDVFAKELAKFETTGDVPALLCAVGPDGKFTSDCPQHEGVWVKDADKAISRELKESGRLLLLDQYLHDYPFCWRAQEDPLIQYPRESWFIRTTDFRDQMLENNSKIGWSPENIRDGRFGKFLESNVDWALSRERYWGTPLPIWECEETGRREAVSSYEEVLSKPGRTGTEIWEKAKAENPDLAEDLKVHKPYIDAITYDSPFAPGARMRRVTEVIDCWYDSGAMPFAQWGYPHQNKDRFEKAFPADFISEAIDQTRGWFYSQLAISTMLFGEQLGQQDSQKFPHPYRNCIVLGLMLAEWYESKDGKQRFLTEDEARQALGKKYVSKTGKMSKSLRNYRSPQEIFDNHGADALRWYFFANQPPWSSIIYSERAIRDSIPEFLLRMWNVLSFFTIYAEIDQFAGPSEINGQLDQLAREELSQAASYRPVEQRAELDRWILSELSMTTGEVIARMDRYDSFGACQQITSLVNELSNWYVRRSRDRYWGKANATESVDKADAYWTLYEVLIQLSKLIAPFVPFVSELMWQTLTESVRGRVRESVHLCDYPALTPDRCDAVLSARMQVLQEVASLGRSARMDAKLKVRQPLSRVEVSLASDEHMAWLTEHNGIVCEELNVKEVAYNAGNSPYIQYQVLPNFKKLGPRVGKQLPALKAALAAADGAQLVSDMASQGYVQIALGSETLKFDHEELEVRLQAKSGWTAAQGKYCVVVLSTDLTPALLREGMARDVVRLIQDLRKQRDCQFTDRIIIHLDCQDSELTAALLENKDYIVGETLAVEFRQDSAPPAMECQTFEVAGHSISLGIEVV
ncbi:isoleucine--tRNA ligase [Aureliella helgolandensis]|uniref:Isoleucine--tRNA ligase n=1 Tax=Aureliella helgolandensis TaxID=2527968 RepID=A0A518G097_9BACT|nr:isoleucine--tRNA ligase [Aureliella helgolandensis]QDV22032.1 Isoleucine--tRNA ligase [Aureliella helgolandensis]